MSKKKVTIIDYGLCNLFSVISACKQVGMDPIVTSDNDVILNSEAVILPGVGAFGVAMECIREKNLDITIRKFIETKKPFLGICLGFHLLFDKSEEFGEHLGLGVLEGEVKKLPKNCGKIPQINWNKIEINPKHKKSKMLVGLKDDDYMYFVHSFFVEPKNHNDTLTYTTYGDLKYCSSVCRDNVFAFQFHPEKSSTDGLKIYKNFMNLI